MSYPYILSASRREDIPAFKSEWFINTLKEGHINICGGYRDYQIFFDKVKFIVFWTKNPRPIIQYLDDLPYDYYFQYTLNFYPEYEKNVPPILNRVKTFIDLSKKIGKEKVIWRFDPIIVNETISVDNVLERIDKIGRVVHPYTEKLVFSFIDPYYKLKNKFRELTQKEMNDVSEGIKNLNKNWGLNLATCAEISNFDGIEHNKCIDPELIQKICGEDSDSWLKYKKDKTQRNFCGCIESSDIGSFKSCRHQCEYCYGQ